MGGGQIPPLKLATSATARPAICSAPKAAGDGYVRAEMCHASASVALSGSGRVLPSLGSLTLGLGQVNACIDSAHPRQRDQVMMTLRRRIVLGELDLVLAFQVVDGTD